MLATKELKEYMKECLKDVNKFTTKQLKELLQNNGIVYKKDYDVHAFSNAIAALRRQNYIINYDTGKYKVNSLKEENQNIIKEESKENVLPKNALYEEKEKEIIHEEKEIIHEEKEIIHEEKEEIVHEQKELEEIRKKILKCLKDEYAEIEGILDTVKPSVFGKNLQTYEDILGLLKYLENFKFTVE